MTVDTQKLRELGHTLNGMLLPDGYNRSALKSAAAALPALLDEIERLTQQNAGLMEQHGRDSQELRRLCEDRDQARRTAQYWKDQHLAGTAEIARLREALTEVLAKKGSRWHPTDPIALRAAALLSGKEDTC